MTQSSKTVEIAGAGLAGLALAAALGRGGWQVVVHEAADVLRSAGGGLYISKDGLWALEQIGAAAAFVARSHAPDGFETWINERMHRAHQNDGVFRTALRNDLHDILAAAARDAGVEIRTGSTVQAADASGAFAMADGTTRTADLVIVANGVGSKLYASLGFDRDSIIHDDGLLRVLLDRRGLAGGNWNYSKDFWSYEPEPLRILYSPCSPRHCYLVMMVSSDDGPRQALPPNMDLWTPSFPMLAPLLARPPIEARVDRYGSIRLSAWTTGRAVIVGDAAHAMPSSHGRGANIAMRTAVELGLRLAATDDIEAALQAWERDMRPQIAAGQEEAEYLASSRSLHRGFPKIDLDDLVPTNMKTA